MNKNTGYKGSILVVEDEALVAMDIRRNLESMGYEVPAIISVGEEVSEKVRQLQPNLVMLDIKLEGRMTGVDAACELRKFTDIPIIFLTAYCDGTTLQSAQLVEPANYLLKPFSQRELFIAIEIALFRYFLSKKRKDEEARLREELCPMFLDSLPALYLVLNHEGRIIRCNSACEKTLGRSMQEMGGLHFSDLGASMSEKKKIATLLETFTSAPKSGSWLTLLAGEPHVTTPQKVAWSVTPIGEGDAFFLLCIGVTLNDLI